MLYVPDKKLHWLYVTIGILSGKPLLVMFVRQLHCMASSYPRDNSVTDYTQILNTLLVLLTAFRRVRMALCFATYFKVLNRRVIVCETTCFTYNIPDGLR
jgi:hypothetical protein